MGASTPRRPAPESVGPRLSYQADPIGASLRALDKKWTLLILRDLAFLRLTRFTEFLRNNPGLTPRVLSRRLREMQAEELVRRSGRGKAVSYSLTPRGQDAVFILLAYLKYGLKHHADEPARTAFAGSVSLADRSRSTVKPSLRSGSSPEPSES